MTRFDEIEGEYNAALAEKEGFEAVVAELKAELVAADADKAQGRWVDGVWYDATARAKKANSQQLNRCCLKLKEIKREKKALREGHKMSALWQIARSADLLQGDTSDAEADDLWDAIESGVSDLDEHHRGWRKWGARALQEQA